MGSALPAESWMTEPSRDSDINEAEAEAEMGCAGGGGAGGFASSTANGPGPWEARGVRVLATRREAEATACESALRAASSSSKTRWFFAPYSARWSRSATNGCLSRFTRRVCRETRGASPCLTQRGFMQRRAPWDRYGSEPDPHARSPRPRQIGCQRSRRRTSNALRWTL